MSFLILEALEALEAPDVLVAPDAPDAHEVFPLDVDGTAHTTGTGGSKGMCGKKNGAPPLGLGSNVASFEGLVKSAF